MTIYLAPDLADLELEVRRRCPEAQVKISNFLPFGYWAVQQGHRLTFRSVSQVVDYDRTGSERYAMSSFHASRQP